MDDIHRKRLEWIAREVAGEPFPEALFPAPIWSATAEAARAALDEIDRFHNLSFDTRSCDLRWVGDKPVLIYSGFDTEDEAKAFHSTRSPK